MESATLWAALTAGVFAALNPCAFVMLPAYLALLLESTTTDDPPTAVGAPSQANLLGVRVSRAVIASVCMTVGFVLVFAVLGTAVTRLSMAIQQHLPWFTMAVGAALLLIGLALVLGLKWSPRIPRPSWAPSIRSGGGQVSYSSWVLYGIAYALASFTCTFGPILALSGLAMRGSSWLTGTAVFVAFALGMGALIVVLSTAVAFVGNGIMRSVREWSGVITRVSALFVVLAGAYLLWYGWYEVRAFVLNPGQNVPLDPVVLSMSHLNKWITRLLSEGIGQERLAVWLLGLVCLGIAAASTRLILSRQKTGRHSRGSGPITEADVQAAQEHQLLTSEGVGR